MRTPSRAWFVWLLVLPLGGCSGWLSSPSRSGLADRQMGGYCHEGVFFHDDAMEIEITEDLFLEISPEKDKLNGTILLEVTLTIPAGVDARLVRTEVRLTSPAWPAAKTLVVSYIEDYAGRRFKPGATLTGTRGEIETIYTLWYEPEPQTMAPQTGIAQVQSFTVELPELEIDGRSFKPPAATFHAYTTRPSFSCRP